MSDIIQQQSSAAELVEQLTRGSATERQATADALRKLGASAVEPLCNLLKHPDKNVRAQAAEILGDVGDVRAVKPLHDALRGCFAWEKEGPGGWILLMLGTMILVMMIFGLLFDRSMPPLSVLYAMMVATWCGSLVLSLYLVWWRGSGRLRQVWEKIADALVRIAEREPTPELRTVIPDLSRLSKEAFAKAETRDIARQAAQRITAITEQLKSLPIPAAEPAPNVKELPIPAHESLSDVATLPRSSQSKEGR